MEYQGEREFRTIHNLREQLREFYHSPLGLAFQAYLNSESKNATDAVMSSDGSNVARDCKDRGRADAYFAIANLPDYLFSIKLQNKEIENGTKVD